MDYRKFPVFAQGACAQPEKIPISPETGASDVPTVTDEQMQAIDYD